MLTREIRENVADTTYKNFVKSRGKHLYQSLFFNKVGTLLKKKLWHWCFYVNFAKFLRIAFFYRAPPLVTSDNEDSLNRKSTF